MEQKILIVAATQFELAPLIKEFNLADQHFAEHPNFDVLITGVGMVATAFALGQYVKREKYRLALNVGIAGSFGKDLALGSLVSVELDCLTELGAEDHDNFLTIDELGFGTNQFSATAEVGNFAKVNGITVNTVHGNAKSIEWVQSRFKPQVETMEGAAFFYACSQMALPCAQIRAISNEVTPRNKEEWKIGLAIQNLNIWLIDWLRVVGR